MGLTKPILLLDGDLIVYRNAIASEREVKWDEQNVILQSNLVRAWDSIQRTIDGYKTTLKSDRAILVFGEGRSFRKGLTDTYKANRKATRLPLGLQHLRTRVMQSYECKSFPGLEGDDTMGIIATTPMKTPRIIVSDDKDMKTIPGTLFRQGELIEVSEVEADYWHMYQTLVGDTADGYAGLPGCGPKGAEKLLVEMPAGPIDPEVTHVEWMWGRVVEAFEKKGLTEEDALLQARLARILRWSDWDEVKKEPILWQPK